MFQVSLELAMEARLATDLQPSDSASPRAGIAGVSHASRSHPLAATSLEKGLENMLDPSTPGESSELQCVLHAFTPSKPATRDW